MSKKGKEPEILETKEEIIEAMVDKEPEIIRKTAPDGTVTYWNPEGEKEVWTYTRSLEEAVSLAMGRLEKLVDMLGDDAYEDFGFIAEELIKTMINEVEEAFRFINRDIGVISLNLIGRNHGYPTYRTNRVVGVTLEPTASPASA